MGGSVVKFSLSEILPAAESTGFKVEMVEKVFHLFNLLNALNSHPFLKGKWVLKGGSALNLFDLHKLAAGKLAVLLSRCQARDLFDSHQILQMNNIERDRLRTAFV